jgi:eukaryotic-like serine/threonine-protein kinase
MEQPQLGRYIIDSEIGRGAMGVVFKATDSVLQRTVAVKTVNMAMEKDHADKYEARFYQEARAAGALNHPNIVTVYDAGKAGDVVYMAMEYIQGVELRSLLVEGQAMGVSQAISIAAQVAEGLGYAHAQGVVHRDIKPANIMVVSDGPVKITDFGIARMRAAADLTQTGVMLGSPKYMSPEQVIGKRADHRSDIFSLGVILYEMLTGAAPFSGENVTALMYQIVNFAPPAPSSVNRQVPEMLDFVIAKMLAKPLEERYQDAREVAKDLRECERALTPPVIATQTGRPSGLATGTHHELLDTRAKSVVLAQSVTRSREMDNAPQKTADETGSPLARGVSHSFDSHEATQRLASLTGASSLPVTATQAVHAVPHAPRAAWRRRDWLLVGGAVLAGLVVAGAILSKK